MKLKQSIQNEHLLRINNARDFINRNLSQCISLKDIARAGYFSEYHFHRLFSALLGETVNDYLSRKRLERAANLLVYRPHYNLADIANQCGFSSQSNFSKAFKEYFGYTPSQFRDPTNEKNCKIGKITSKYGKHFSPKDMYPEYSLGSVLRNTKRLKQFMAKVEIREIKRDISLAFITSSGGREKKSVCDAWQQLLSWARVNAHSSGGPTTIYGICHDNPLVTPIERCRYDAAIEIGQDTDVNSPFFKTSIPPGKYAVVHYMGPKENVIGIYKELYSVLLVNSGYVADDYPVVEHYFNNPAKGGQLKLDICIKLKST